ncbi:NPCBM/NEW2 domain-containing protein [Kitasatospora sp. NPDC048365]|uniref:NPCBM/NEW2 domain-containing protein n=1 Tax=Kitasatospora sp. NPDC048365 TaxID=3364050 RepID=UPI00371162CD
MASVPRKNRHRVTGFATALALLGGTTALSAVAVVGLQTAAAAPAAALQNSLAQTPQMGFNNWNSTGCRAEFNEAMVKGIADLFVTQGLKDAGYTYVNLDDCWALPARDAAGNLVPDPVRFPHGIKSVADYVHDKGLKFGIYSSAGTKTCASNGFPGGLGHEQQDANLWASWGVDYLKYDSCYGSGVERYQVMGDALKATGRPILYGICEWGTTRPWTWARDVGSSWRTTGDIGDSWGSMIGIAHVNQALAPFAGPGEWNDPDMLEVGNGHMTDTEYRTHFSLWAEMAAPLLIGTDLRKVTPATYEILKNTDVIAVDQDPLGRQGTVIANNGGLVVMSKPLADGSRAITLTNETATTQTVSTTAAAAGIGGASSYTLKDLWSKATSQSDGTITATLPSHGTAMYRLTPALRTDMPGGTFQLGDLAPTATYAAAPVERDHSAGGPGTGDGRPLTINSVQYRKGLGTRAETDVHYYLGGTCRNLVVDVGVDDETPEGSVIFRVYRDSTVVADSGPRTAGQGALRLTADLTGGEELRLITTAPGSDGSGHGDWAEPRLTCGPTPGSDATTASLTARSWTTATNGWGPVETDRSNGESGAGDGRNPLRIGTSTYDQGIGTNAPSLITYNLGGSCTALTTDVGIDEEVGSKGSATFQIYADGQKVADSGLLTGQDGPVRLTARLDGAQELLLQVSDGGDGKAYDHADWAGIQLTCA